VLGRPGPIAGKPAPTGYCTAFKYCAVPVGAQGTAQHSSIVQYLWELRGLHSIQVLCSACGSTGNCSAFKYCAVPVGAQGTAQHSSIVQYLWELRGLHSIQVLCSTCGSSGDCTAFKSCAVPVGAGLPAIGPERANQSSACSSPPWRLMPYLRIFSTKVVRRMRKRSAARATIPLASSSACWIKPCSRLPR